MIRIYTLLAAAALIASQSSCTNNDNENALKNDPVAQEQMARDSVKNSMETANIAFTASHHDFGTVQEGEKLTHTFLFQNTGEYPLYISNVISPCGCTVPEYDKQPILPGKEGKITIEFNTQGRLGNQEKKLTVIANIPQEHTYVSFKATVEE